MQFSEDQNTGKYFINSYHPGEIKINQTVYAHSIIVTAESLSEWPPQTIDELKSQDFDIVAKQNPEVVLLGTGKKQYFPKAAILATLIEHNIGFEIMDTAAACRTYNALMAEGRRVVAALIIE